MTFMLLNYYREEQSPRAGLLLGGEKVIDVQKALESKKIELGEINPSSVLSLLENWDYVHPVFKETSRDYSEYPSATIGLLSEIYLAAPVLFPPNIYCAAANYVDHAKEMTGRDMPDKRNIRPFFFTKAPKQTVIGPNDAIRIPYPEAKVDWEAELGIVIGRQCRKASPNDAMKYVAGFIILNDVSDRARLFREDWDFKFDWFGCKSFNTSAPMGPWITPVESISDPHNLTIQLWVNNELMQDSSSRNMYFTIPEQIEYLSGMVTLLPGDIIATGTPAGVGHPRGQYLKPKDTVKISIEALGSIKNPVVAGY